MPARLLHDEAGEMFGLYNEADDEVTIIIDDDTNITMRSDGTTTVRG